LPENAEQLMRSRYSAYALGELEYLKASWHADFLPTDLVIDERIGWLGLTIISSNQLGCQATVEFEARLLLDGRVDAMHENSNFVSVGGRWLYTDGEMLAPSFTPWKPARNEPCPCGSGKKFKRCCARR
jgi:SEC-C motif-containing protein